MESKLPIRPILHGQAAPRFGPDVDGYFLPEPVPSIYASGQQAHIPLLAGWNKDEGRASTPGERFNPAVFAAEAELDLPGRGPELLRLYPIADTAEAFKSASAFAGDEFIAYSTWSWLEAQVATGGATVYSISSE